MSAFSSNRRSAASCISGSNTWYRPLPFSFAMYIATSALRRAFRTASLRRCRPRSATAMPTLARTNTSLPSSTNGSSSICMMRLATSMADAFPAVLEQDGELVPAESGGRVRRAERLLQPLARPRSSSRRRGMAERVVDRLEVVDVHEEHRDRLRSRSCRSRRAARDRGTARGSRGWSWVVECLVAAVAPRTPCVP